jgi:acylphosphatase
MTAQSLDPVRVQLIIEGRVQGVYFRAATVNEAQHLGLTGWVMNCPDGSVKAVAEGQREEIERLIAWCHQGPSGARVTRVDVQWQEAQNSFKGFAVRR